MLEEHSRLLDPHVVAQSAPGADKIHFSMPASAQDANVDAAMLEAARSVQLPLLVHACKEPVKSAGGGAVVVGREGRVFVR